MHSGLVLAIAQWVSIAIGTLVLLLVVYILTLRATLLRKERRYHALLKIWQPILLCTGEQSLDRLPKLGSLDRVPFLIIWNSLFEAHDNSDIREWMIAVAKSRGLIQLARQLLDDRRIRTQLLAIVTLGQLRDQERWNALSQMSDQEHALLSLASTQAIARIDPQKAVSIVIPKIIRRSDWPVAKVATILKEMGPDLVSEPLRDALMKTASDEMQRLIPYLETCHAPVARSAVQQILANRYYDDRVISPCLNVIGKFHDKTQLERVRQYLNHTRWHLRAAAASCLGKIGGKEDEKQLMSLLADPEWWVRYRAAQSLVKLAAADKNGIRKMRESLGDRYAKDILTQVLAETTVSLP